MAHRHSALIPWMLGGLSCAPPPEKPQSSTVEPVVEQREAAPEVELPAPRLQRLTQRQYLNSLAALFGEGLLVGKLEPDEELEGLLVVGGSVTTISPYGVEQYETAAFDVPEQVVADPERLAQVLPCSPSGAEDLDCLEQSLRQLGRLAWRRPLSADELDRLMEIGQAAISATGEWGQGLSYGIAALLQSPYFLFRVELGEDDGAGGHRYSSLEMASRLSYFLWNGPPDDELLVAAEAGELIEEAGLVAQVDRLIADDRAREGVRNLYTEAFELYLLDELSKDPTVYVHMTEEIGPSAKEETLLGIEHLVFQEDGDLRDLLTTRRTFLNRELAALYNVPAPAREGFGETTLPEEEQRRGLLGQASFLALQSHAVATSPTLRGLFIREVLLCQPLPDPPANVDTSIPEASAEAPTMRERIAAHLEVESCASCHILTDPIGLGLENYDGLGGWRLTENSVTIDASGDVDGSPFNGPSELAEALAAHPSLGPCMAATVYRYAGGHVLAETEMELVDWHASGFEQEGHRLKWLLRDVATSPGFRRTGALE